MTTGILGSRKEPKISHIDIMGTTASGNDMHGVRCNAPPESSNQAQSD